LKISSVFAPEMPETRYTVGIDDRHVVRLPVYRQFDWQRIWGYLPALPAGTIVVAIFPWISDGFL
jgi:hypothetical protein